MSRPVARQCRVAGPLDLPRLRRGVGSIKGGRRACWNTPVKKIKVGLKGVHRASPSQLGLLEGDACQRIATATERKLRTEETYLNGDRELSG